VIIVGKKVKLSRILPGFVAAAGAAAVTTTSGSLIYGIIAGVAAGIVTALVFTVLQKKK